MATVVDIPSVEKTSIRVLLAQIYPSLPLLGALHLHHAPMQVPGLIPALSSVLNLSRTHPCWRVQEEQMMKRAWELKTSK
jgi:hypothetical protein